MNFWTGKNMKFQHLGGRGQPHLRIAYLVLACICHDNISRGARLWLEGKKPPPPETQTTAGDLQFSTRMMDVLRPC